MLIFLFSSRRRHTCCALVTGVQTCALPICPQRHVTGDDDDFGLEVAAPILVLQGNRVARPQEAVRSALIHQRIVPEAVGHRGAARLPHQRDVVHISRAVRSEEHTSELQSLMRISYAVFCLKKKKSSNSLSQTT